MTEWTKTAPSAPGWYWWRCDGSLEIRERWHCSPTFSERWRGKRGHLSDDTDGDGEWWPEPIPSPEEIAALYRDREAALDDIGAILRALGLGDHARSISAHAIVHDEIVPAIEKQRAALNAWLARYGHLGTTQV